MWQTLIVLVLVVASAVYAAWTLMPAAARRPLAASLLKLPLPRSLSQTLRRAAQASAGGCGCDGCDHAPSKAAPSQAAAQQTITFHPRVRR